MTSTLASGSTTITDSSSKQRGRPNKYKSEDEMKAAKRQQLAKAKHKYYEKNKKQILQKHKEKYIVVNRSEYEQLKQLLHCLMNDFYTSQTQNADGQSIYHLHNKMIGTIPDESKHWENKSEERIATIEHVGDFIKQILQLIVPQNR